MPLRRRRPLSVDLARIAKAMQGPGNDTRTWLESGTVGVVDSDGRFSTTDQEAVFVDRKGALVSVRLEPLGEIVTARWNGLAVGRFGNILVPLRPGDEVQVAIPGGDLNSPGIAVVNILSNETAQIPADWENDRVLFAMNVPIEIRGPAISIRSGNLVLNGRPVSRVPRGI